MSTTDFLFAQSALEQIGRLEEHFTLRRSNIHINCCGGCGGPAYQQPCAICNFYPMGDDNRSYFPKVATFEHFGSSLRRSAPVGADANLATWYFKTKFERVTVMKGHVPEMIAQASKLDNMPSAETVWRIVVDEERSLRRARPPLHVQYGWDAIDGLNHLLTHRQMDTKLATRIGKAVETWVQAVHSDDLDATVSALDEVGLILRNHTAHIVTGNRTVALKAAEEAVENLPSTPAPTL